MAKVSRERLIVFTRFPEPGKTKTRLIPLLGAEGAARLQRRMTEHTIAIAATAGRRSALTVEVCHEGGSKALMQQWLGPQFIYRLQGPGDVDK